MFVISDFSLLYLRVTAKERSVIFVWVSHTPWSFVTLAPLYHSAWYVIKRLNEIFHEEMFLKNAKNNISEILDFDIFRDLGQTFRSLLFYLVYGKRLATALLLSRGLIL